MAGQMEALLSRAPVEGRRVLDAATGRGRAAIACARHGATEVLALDVSADMLAAAQLDARHAGVDSKIRFERDDVACPSRTLRGFDVAFLLEALLHFDEPAVVLATLHGALVPGGRLVLTTVGANPLTRLFMPGRRNGRPATRIQIAAATLANQLMTPVFGFQWRRTAPTASLYRRVFDVPLRPLRPSTVRRLLRGAGFSAIEHHGAPSGALPREHRWVARRPSGLDERVEVQVEVGRPC
jgi:2-polyprenyl-3-methyl-5-hydroxy-6-metoxy-1,4-benzoquinol methylase